MMKKKAAGDAAPIAVATPKVAKEWFKIIRGDKVTRKKMPWLWHRYLPLGMITLLTGDPQAGKSTLICDLVARLSRGDPLPGEPEGPRPIVRSWIMSSEDSIEHIIAWRLFNQGADMSQVILTDERAGLQGAGLKHFERVIVENKLGLVVIDTTTTWMGGELDGNKLNDVMGWLNPLKEIAGRTMCTIVLIRHKRKGAAGDNPLYSGGGSIGWTAAVRSELMAEVRKKGNQRTLKRSKGNIGAPPPTLMYEINPHDDPENDHGVLSWTGVWDEPVDLNEGPKASNKPKKFKECQDWLKVVLAAGKMPSKALFQLGLEAGYSDSTIKRAKVGVAISYNDGAEWVWAIDPAVETVLGPDGNEYMVCR